MFVDSDVLLADVAARADVPGWPCAMVTGRLSAPHRQRWVGAGRSAVVMVSVIQVCHLSGLQPRSVRVR
jgi:hypothetical protein